DDRKAGAQLARLLRQQLDVAVGRERLNLEGAGIAPDQIDRVAADRAGRTQHRDAPGRCRKSRCRLLHRCVSPPFRLVASLVSCCAPPNTPVNATKLNAAADSAPAPLSRRYREARPDASPIDPLTTTEPLTESAAVGGGRPAGRIRRLAQSVGILET